MFTSLLTLAVQNAALSIVMHYSRVSTPASQAYSPAAAVLLNEVLKGSISFVIALARTPNPSIQSLSTRRPTTGIVSQACSWRLRLTRLCSEIFARDCLKLSIPAILYVIQNSLQFVAISNLPVASFQVAYQMKIMTTAAFSVALLGKRLTKAKWMALLLLAIGVGIVQIQTATGSSHGKALTEKAVDRVVGSAADAAPLYTHVMNTYKGFAAVIAACFTSGLAGVYFEMVLKNSKADLWVRNVQLSLFSLIPALLPIVFAPSNHGPWPALSLSNIFHNFGAWAWATVSIQVFGGLVTAIVIKYSDNILKGFATSLSIVLSFLASVILFDYRITSSFLLGASTVLAATWMYNQPAATVSPPSITVPDASMSSSAMREKAFEEDDMDVIPRVFTSSVLNEKASFRHSTPASQLSNNASTQSLSSMLGMSNTLEVEHLNRERRAEYAFLGQMARAENATYGNRNTALLSPYVSRSPSPFMPLSRSGSTSSMDLPRSTDTLLPPGSRLYPDA